MKNEGNSEFININKSIPNSIGENPLDSYIERVGYTIFHRKHIFIFTMLFFLVGAQFNLLNVVLSTIANEWNLSQIQMSLLGSSLFVGASMASFASGNAYNKYGRRLPTIYGCIVISFFNLWIPTLTNFYQLFFIQFFIGIGTGIVSPGIGCVLAEMIPKKNRGITLNFIGGSYPIGMMYVSFIALQYVQRNLLNWRITCFINSFMPLIIAFCCFFIKESPRYLLMLKQFDEGIKILNSLGREERLTSEEEKGIFEFYKKKKNEGEIHYYEYFEGDLFWISINLIYIWWVTGVISMGLLYTMPKYFEYISEHNIYDSLKNEIISAYIFFFCPFVRGIIAEFPILGRKGSMALGFVGSAISVMYILINETNLSVLTGCFNFFINITLGSVGVYTTEIYTTKLRAGANGLGFGFNRLGGVFAPFLVDIIDSKVKNGTFYLFGLMSLIGIVSSLCLKYETIGMLLDTIGKKTDEEDKLR